MGVEVIHGDMREVLGKMVAEGKTVQSVVTDPPYHLTMAKRLGNSNTTDVEKNFTKTNEGQGVNPFRSQARGFMGKAWDGGDIAFQPGTWRLCFELLPPGGHLLAFAGTRTYHRMAVAIEEAGFEIRDTIAWLYGSGFPKSLNVSKAIDKAAGVEGTFGAPKSAAHAGWIDRGAMRGDEGHEGYQRPWMKDEAAVDRAARQYTGGSAAARQWDGWGTALKPAAEYVCVAQKPYENSQLLEMIGSTLKRLEHQTWSLLPANVAAEIFGLSPSEHDAACGSAPWSAAERSNTQDALSARMDTSRCVLATLSSLNTVRSWRDCLADASTDASTSTTETASSTIIDPKIWKSCLSKITPASIIQAHGSGAWSSANAGTAERYLNAEALRLSAIRERSAIDSASDLDAICSPHADDLRPGLDLICVARKPLQGTVAANVLKHGTGALNIDGCRIAHASEAERDAKMAWAAAYGGKKYEDNNAVLGAGLGTNGKQSPDGRWPANVCHDNSDEVVRAFPDSEVSGSAKNGRPALFNPNRAGVTSFDAAKGSGTLHNDSGSAARFFYSARPDDEKRFWYGSKADADDRLASRHPTIKPVDLMRWLVRLITPPGGTCLDPFAGSGTTGMACMAEGFDCILIEREAEYVADIKARIAHVHGDDTPLFSGVMP